MTGRLDFTHLRNAIASLEESMRVVSGEEWFYAQDPAVQNTLIAGVIQNFEFVYDIGAVMIRRQLELEALAPTEADQDNYRDILRHAAEKGLITDIEAWFRYREMRNITSHTYNHEKANRVYQGVSAFVADAGDLLAKLERRHA